jgi:farnesyl diphosphate synthase
VTPLDIKMLDCNVLGGKLNRGLAVADTLRILKPDATKEDLYLANVLGWCIEWLQAVFLVADDIMDDSIVRRDKPCWYRQPHVQMTATNDYLIMESQIYRILKKYFRHLPIYMDLWNLFRDTTYQTELGQMNDCRIQPPNQKEVDFTKFTIETYKLIVKYKTAYYTFNLPIACGLVLSNVTDEKVFKAAEDICLQMGEYFQIQDDYLDCYADPLVLGKVGRDIEEGKCCWIIVQALSRANSEQRQVLEQCYKKDNTEAVARVKQVYKELGMENIYHEYEEKALQALHQSIESYSSTVNKDIFLALLNKISKRQK